MLTPSKTFHQLSLFETDLLLQLDATDSLLLLAAEIPWDINLKQWLLAILLLFFRARNVQIAPI